MAAQQNPGLSEWHSGHLDFSVGRKIKVTPFCSNETPALKTHYVTFGSLGRLTKVSPRIIGAWSRILCEVRGATLLLHADAGSHREHLLNQFTGHGVNTDRIRFVGRMPFADYYALYHEIDITLDTYPCSGGTTTCDSLWMGVPVVTWAGAAPMTRGGVSILANVGLADYAAESEDDFIRVAVSLARDIPRLATLRGSLRQRMLASPLMDARQFARDVEDAYRRAWHGWCAGSAMAER